MLALHAPIRVYLMDMDRRAAHDMVMLDELNDYVSVLGYDRFEMVPCSIGGRTFNVAKMVHEVQAFPASMRSPCGDPVARGNVVVLGYDEEGHRSLTDEEVMHIERNITMTITFKPVVKTHYVINDATILEMRE